MFARLLFVYLVIGFATGTIGFAGGGAQHAESLVAEPNPPERPVAEPNAAEKALGEKYAGTNKLIKAHLDELLKEGDSREDKRDRNAGAVSIANDILKNRDLANKMISALQDSETKADFASALGLAGDSADRLLQMLKDGQALGNDTFGKLSQDPNKTAKLGERLQKLDPKNERALKSGLSAAEDLHKLLGNDEISKVLEDPDERAALARVLGLSADQSKALDALPFMYDQAKLSDQEAAAASDAMSASGKALIGAHIDKQSDTMVEKGIAKALKLPNDRSGGRRALQTLEEASKRQKELLAIRTLGTQEGVDQ